jgi:antitoxin (DNA-binding transcriptional repressor) of toxin-antitoxin stability system
MLDVTLDHAKVHLEDLIDRARRGEDVRIATADGVVRLSAVPAEEAADVKSVRITDTISSFARLGRPRVPGSWRHRLAPPPHDFFDPLTGEELELWYKGE